MKRAINAGEKAYQDEVKRLSLASSLGKPEALSGPVLTIRMIETIVASSAQAAASRAMTDSLGVDVRRLRMAVKRAEQAKRDWLRPVIYGLSGGVAGGALVALTMLKWLAGHY